ncbi:hypothetical protein ACHHV8_25550 [Paenibacillus sp. TAB 01]|uniref:hypothetical protein n=1 Tax=Paenibacillus sp. TAB 01 TaxID=3368988 RepID=UPI003750C3AE
MAEWKQEVLYVRRNEKGHIIEIEEETPQGFESDKQWVQVNKTKKVPDQQFRIIGD